MTGRDTRWQAEDGLRPRFWREHGVLITIIAAYVGAGIAGAPVMKTGFTAMRLGMAAYLVPFIFVYWPALVIWHEAPLYRVVLALLGGAVGVYCMGGIGERYLTRELPWVQVALLAIAIVAVMHPAAIANVIAVAIALGVGLWEWRASREGTR